MAESKPVATETVVETSGKTVSYEDVPREPPLPPPRSSSRGHFVLDLVLRCLLFASSLVAVVVMVTANETELVINTSLSPVPFFAHAKFRYSPAFVYFVAALSVAGLYSIISILASLCAIVKPSSYFLLHLALWDVLMLGLVASAVGTAGGVAYIGKNGNSHVQWDEICHIYGSFCRHLAASLGVSLVAGIVLVLLLMLSICSLHAKARRNY